MSTYIGIDIGSRYTKVIELETKPAVKLTSNIIFRTPYIFFEQPHPEQLDTKNFWQKITKHIPLERIKTARIAVNIPSSSVMALTLHIPRIARHEVGVVAQTEARRRMIPSSGPNHIFESSLIGERIINKLPRFEVLTVRVEKIYVQQVLDLFKEVDVIPRIISFSSCSLTTLFPQELLTKKEVDVAFIDIGMTSINTSIFKEGRLNFFRNTAFGLKDIIQDMGSNLSLSDNEVEDIIKQNGVPDVNVDLKDKVAVAEEIMRQKYEASLKAAEPNQKEEINLLELRRLWQVHIERIIHELRRSLAYYKEQAEGRRVEYLYFLGGGCQIKNLVNLLTEQIGGQWQIASALNSPPIFTNAASLALSFVTKVRGAEMINFLPVELKKKEFIATRRLVLRIAKIVLIFMLSLLSISRFITNRSIKLSIKAAESELEGVKKIVSTLKDLNQQEERRNKLSLQILELLKTRKDFYLVLNKLSSAIPGEVLINSISINKETNPSAKDSGLPYKIQAKAEVFADYEKASRIIENLRSNLEGSFYFKNVYITPIRLEKITQAGSIAGGDELRLTLPKARVFVVTADISEGK